MEYHVPLGDVAWRNIQRFVDPNLYGGISYFLQGVRNLEVRLCLVLFFDVRKQEKVGTVFVKFQSCLIPL